MFFNVLILFGLGCSETGLSSVQKDEEQSWFDEASALYRDDFDPDADEYESDDDESDEDDLENTESDDDDSTPPEDYDSPDNEDEDLENDPVDDPDADSTPDEDPTNDEDDAPSTSGGDSSSDESDDDSSGEPIIPRSPFPGEVVITELLINPVATDDSRGEWVELRNVSSSWIDMAGAVLADHGVDGVEIEAIGTHHMVVAPGGIFTVCADSDYWENGGVECDATFHYRTLGGGFALSNVEDEVRLLSASGYLLDEFIYTEGFSLEGEAMGLRNDRISVSANDVVANWCEQISFLPFGDGGTPGESNDSCW